MEALSINAGMTSHCRSISPSGTPKPPLGTTTHAQLLSATELLRHGRIKTTKQKAKAIIEHVDKVITWAKQASKLEGASADHKANLAKSFLYDSELVSNIFDEAAERYEDRQGGYTRITPTASRKGDNAEMVYIELV